MMKSVNRSWLLLMLLLLQLKGEAQSFAWKAPLESVTQSGFYRIPLSPDFLWRVKTDLSDLRIRSEKGDPVPFLVEKKPPVHDAFFLDFPILSKTTDTVETILDLDAGRQGGTNRVDLVMNNTAVERKASLSGSDDRKQWFIIDESLWLTNAAGTAGDEFVQSLHFPFVRYRYLRLRIKNNGTDPLPVRKAGLWLDNTRLPAPLFHQNPGTTFRQVDSADGHSYLWVHNQRPYPVANCSLQFGGMKFYRREVQVYSAEKEKRKDLVAVTEIRSGAAPVIWLPDPKAQDLLLVIKNGDNPPLQALSVATFTRQQHLIAYLGAGTPYMLVGGNGEVDAPTYDLAHFRDSIPASLPVLKHGVPTEANSMQPAAAESKRWWLWFMIVLMIGLLGAATLRMAGEARR